MGNLEFPTSAVQFFRSRRTVSCVSDADWPSMDQIWSDKTRAVVLVEILSGSHQEERLESWGWEYLGQFYPILKPREDFVTPAECGNQVTAGVTQDHLGTIFLMIAMKHCPKHLRSIPPLIPFYINIKKTDLKQTDSFRLIPNHWISLNTSFHSLLSV